MDRFAQFAAVAARQACQQAGLEPGRGDPYRVGVIIGSGIGGISTLSQQFGVLNDRGPRRVSPFLIPMMLGDMASAQVSMVTGAMGANYCLVSSCSSGADAMGQAWENRPPGTGRCRPCRWQRSPPCTGRGGRIQRPASPVEIQRKP